MLSHSRTIMLIASASLLLGHPLQAQDSPSAASGQTDQEVHDLDYSPYPYPDEGHPEYGPTDAESSLNEAVPKLGSVFGDVVPDKYFQWKQDLYTNYGLKLGLFAQMLYMSPSETASFATNDNAFGHWWGFDLKWTPLNKGEDYEGSLVLVAAKRGSVGSNAVPAQHGTGDLGSSYAVNFEWTEWDFAFEELYWEQWFKKDRLMVRGGLTAAGSMIDPFRFKDARTSFTATPFAFHESLPAPAQGPGFAIKWWPIEGSGFYVTGVLNDANGTPADGDVLGMNWDSFTKGEFFYNLEFGNVWRRDDGEFHQLYLDVFYVAERSDPFIPQLPNEAGGGFKTLGSTQQGNWVEFLGYTFNTAKGGSIGASLGRHTLTAGAAYLSPFDIQGEIGTGLIWLQPHEGLVPGMELRNQTGVEAYWKVLLTPNLWVTPGFQFVWNPSLNPTADRYFIPHFKFRLAY